MPVRALKRKPYEGKITSIYAKLTDAERQEYLADLRRDAENVHNAQAFRAYCYELWGILCDGTEESLSKFRMAHVLEPTTGRLTRIGLCLSTLGRHDEALDRLAESADRTPCVSSLLGLTVVLSRVGAHAEALATYQDMVRYISPTSHEDFYHALRCAADLGLLAEAAELTVRLLALQHGFLLGEERAIDVLVECRDIWERQFADLPEIISALRRYVTLNEAAHSHTADSEPPSAEGADMFEATRPMRALAAAEHGGRPS